MFGIQSLELKDFRCFDDFKTSFDSRLTVLAGVNGSGKTALLEAVYAILSPSIGQGRQLKDSDRRRLKIVTKNGNQQEFSRDSVVSAVVHLPEAWKDLQNKTRRFDDNLNSLGTPWQDFLFTSDMHVPSTKFLPVVLFITSSAGSAIRLAGDPTRQEFRQFGYENTRIDAQTSTELGHWITRNEIRIAYGKDNERYSYFKEMIEELNIGVQDIYWDVDDAQICASVTSPSGQLSLPYSQLSSGFRRFLTIVFEIFWRASVLNPLLGGLEVRDSEGVVLIDEVELHLHPDWQRRIIPALLKLFPNMQFIISTHSPLVIQSVERQHLIDLSSGSGDAIEIPVGSPEDILEDVMGVDIPSLSKRRLEMLEAAAEFYELIDKTTGEPLTDTTAAKQRLDKLMEPFTRDPAGYALLKAERKKAKI